MATSLINEYYLSNLDKIWNEYPDLCYAFELIHPKYRIIVDYKDMSGLYLHGVFKRDGTEFEPEYISSKYELSFPIPEKYEFDGISDIIKHMDENNGKNDEEGYVITTSSGFKFKFKYKDYVDRCRIIKGLTSNSIYQYCKDIHDGVCFNRPLSTKHIIDEMIKTLKIEEEYINYINEHLELIMTAYNKIANTVLSYIDEIKDIKFNNRKEMYDFICESYGVYGSVIMMILDKKNPHKLLWRLVKNEVKLNSKEY